MSNEYHKIQSIYKRYTEGPNKGKFIIDEYSTPEIEFLKDNQWEFTEKVDGTNIRVMWQPQEGQPVGFGGKTDDASIPSFLYDKLVSIFTYESFVDAGFGTTVEDYITLYGEGYGAKIQKGGGNYISDGVDFILFDVRIGHWWLKRDDVNDIAERLKIKSVPVIGRGTLADAINIVRSGFKSQIADRESEGIVLRPVVDLFTRSGERIITKVKVKDFQP